MTSPSTITQRFLSNPQQIGVVAVGFNGGQVQYPDLIAKPEDSADK